MGKIPGAFFSGLLFATIYFFVALDYLGPLLSALTAVIPAIIFGVLPYLWNRYGFEKKRMDKITGGKEVLFSGEVVYAKGRWGNDGFLYLVSDQLIFKSDLINIRHHFLKIDIEEIEDIEEYDDDSLIPTGVHIKLSSGNHYYFFMYNRPEWITRIRRMRLDIE